MSESVVELGAKTGVLDKAALLGGTESRPVVEFQSQQLGGIVHLRALTFPVIVNVSGMSVEDQTREFIRHGLVSPAGEALFTDAEMKAFLEVQSAAVVKELGDKIAELSGATSEAAEQAEKNS